MLLQQYGAEETPGRLKFSGYAHLRFSSAQKCSYNFAAFRKAVLYF